MPNNKKTKLNRTLKAIRSFEGNLAQWITRVAGSMWFIYFHAIWFAFWIFANEGLFKEIEPFDPFPYGLLTMIVSLEAIFLSAFIMVAQNRMELLDTYRDIEEDIEEAEEEREVQDIQKDLDDIKTILNEITKKLPRPDTQPKKT